MVQLSHPYMTTGKIIAVIIRIFVGKVVSLLFNTLPRFVIAFLPRSKRLQWCPTLCYTTDCRPPSFSVHEILEAKILGVFFFRLCLVAQLCLILCDPTDCSLPGSSDHGDSPGKNTGVGCHALLQGIFPTQGSNPGLPHCKWILYCLSRQGSPVS